MKTAKENIDLGGLESTCADAARGMLPWIGNAKTEPEMEELFLRGMSALQNAAELGFVRPDQLESLRAVLGFLAQTESKAAAREEMKRLLYFIEETK